MNVIHMNVIHEIEPCRRAVREAGRAGAFVGLVPTMGALHEGHLSLIRAARGRCAHVAVTLFVNPTQFVPGEDYQRYPKTLESDLDACRREGVDLVFAPTAETMYSSDASTTVHVGGVTEGMCGRFRPGHFDGVATVVSKLFHILPADLAFFGEKDYQQLIMVEKMVRDLNIPIEIVRCPTVRDRDGLALSSRNRYLSRSERKQAVSLSRSLFRAVEQAEQGERDAEKLCRSIRETILASGPVTLEYVEAVEAETLSPLTTIDRPARICLAVRIGACRLIDNIEIDG